MLSKVIYIIFFLIVIYALYVLNLKSTLEDNEKVIQKIHNNDFLISLSILPIFTENNNSYLTLDSGHFFEFLLRNLL